MRTKVTIGGTLGGRNCPLDMSMTIGAHKEIILKSKDNALKDDPAFIELLNQMGNKAYQDCSFITLDKDDAINIVHMLNEAIIKLDPSPEIQGDDDIRVFGDKAISYERLIDRCDGLIY